MENHPMQFMDEIMTAEESALNAPSDQALRVPYYCEENVWRLLYRKKHECPGDRFWVVFISNAIKNVPMFQQKASSDPNTSVSWDYHVILLTSRSADPPGMVWVYDIDSHLPYPSPLTDYIQQSFPYEWPMPVAPLFRLVEGDLFLQHFASDRRHMYNATKGTWNAPPPNYACIQGAAATTSTSSRDNATTTTTSNLEHYLNFVDRPTFTEIMDPQAFGSILTKQQLASAAFALS